MGEVRLGSSKPKDKNLKFGEINLIFKQPQQERSVGYRTHDENETVLATISFIPPF